MLMTKSVWTKAAKSDGLRILATRFRGRGMPTDRYDVWMANLGPSEALLQKMQKGKLTWAQFKQVYKQEIFLNSKLDQGNATIKNHGQKFTFRLIKHLATVGNVTLMCHCDEDQEHCHRHILQAVILSNKI